MPESACTFCVWGWGKGNKKKKTKMIEQNQKKKKAMGPVDSLTDRHQVDGWLRCGTGLGGRVPSRMALLRGPLE